MKKAVSIFLAVLMLFSIVGSQGIVSYSATKTYAETKLESIQKQTGFIPGKTSIVTGNCYAFVSAVCEKLYGVNYQEGLYGNYMTHQYSGNYIRAGLYTTTSTTPTTTIAKNIKAFFVNNAQPGDIVHYGAYTTGTSNGQTHTFMIHHIDSKKMQIYHSNYAVGGNASTTCHIDTIYWDSFIENPTKSIYNSDGTLYSLNAIFYNKMKETGLGITINRYKKYNDLFYTVDTGGAPDTTVSSAPAKVTELKCTAKDYEALTLSWKKDENAAKYYISVSNNTKGTSFSKTVTTNTPVLSGLTENNSYTIKVKAIASSGLEGAYSDTITVSTKTSTPTVKGLKITERTTTSIKVAWTKATNATKYTVNIKNNTKNTTVTKTTTSTSYKITDLTAGNSYTIKVKAYTSRGGWGAYSSTVTAPTKPKKVSVKNLTSPSTTKLKLTWTKVGGSATGYQIYYSRDSKFQNVVAKKALTDRNLTSYTGKNFTKGKTYYVKIRAYKTVEGTKYYGAWSDVKKVKCK